MNQGDAARLLLATVLQSPLVGGGVLKPLPSLVSSVTVDAKERVIQACIVADASESKQAQIEALIGMWGYLFPETAWTLSKNSATDLLKLAGGSAERAFLYLEDVKGHDDIQWPLAYSKARIQKRMREEKMERQEQEEIDLRMRQALQIAAKGDDDGYIDFRHYIKEANEGVASS